jgi:hypothetical protein
MIEHESEHPASRVLEELPVVEPPAGFVEQVMARISHDAVNRSAGRVVPLDRGGIVMIRKAMWGLAAAAAIVLAVFTVIGFPSANRGTEATIGAAQKYQAPQLAEGDVKVGDASVQEFLQSEAFDRLLKDPQARALLDDSRVRAQLLNRQFTNSLEDMQKRRNLTSDVLHRFYSDAAAVASLNRYLSNGLNAEAAVRRMAEDAALSVAARKAVAEIRASADLVRMLDDNGIRMALADNDFRQFVMDARAFAALTSDLVMNAVRQSGFVDALRSGAVAQAVARDARQQ